MSSIARSLGLLQKTDNEAFLLCPDRSRNRCGLLALVLLLACGCGDAIPGLYPRDRWMFSTAQGRFIFSEWTGRTARRTVFDWDGTPLDVAVIEDVRGPGASEPYPWEGAPQTRPSLFYLTNANDGPLLPDDVPVGTPVRVDGFLRPGRRSINTFNAKAGFWQLAGTKPPPADPAQRGVEKFPIIKTRRIWEKRADGTERLVWETPVPFRGL